jgi:hypothetical protein
MTLIGTDREGVNIRVSTGVNIAMNISVTNLSVHTSRISLMCR